MASKFSNLDDLIVNDPEANQYFSSLPSNVKQQIMARSDSINSFESLQTYAKNLLGQND